MCRGPCLHLGKQAMNFLKRKSLTYIICASNVMTWLVQLVSSG